MMRLCSRFIIRQNFSSPKFKTPTPDLDLANITGLIHTENTPSLSFAQKLSYLSPSNMYHNLDELSRDLLFTLSDQFSLGLPLSVIAISLLIKATFFYPTLKAQVMALKMKQIQPVIDKFQEKMKIAQMSRNTAMIKQAKNQFNTEKRKKGIDNFYAVYNILQIPFLITWFLSLRYVAGVPQLFPSVQQSFLWIEDLSTFDPYFILPLISACLTSYSIVISPAANRQVAIPMFANFMKYLKFLPFVSLPITAFFPALLNLYWATLASSQLALMVTLNSQYIKKKMGIIKIDPKSQILKAVYIEQPTQKQASNKKPQISAEHIAQKISISNKRGKKKKTQ